MMSQTIPLSIIQKRCLAPPTELSTSHEDLGIQDISKPLRVCHQDLGNQFTAVGENAKAYTSSPTKIPLPSPP